MGREYPATPLTGVGAVILDGDRAVMIRRAHEPKKGCWALPGGMVELGETLLHAVTREAHEETGLDVEPLGLIELLDRIIWHEDRVRYHYIIADYLCRVTGGTLRAGSDASEVCWVGREHWHAQSEYQFDTATLRVLEAAWQQARNHQQSS